MGYSEISGLDCRRWERAGIGPGLSTCFYAPLAQDSPQSLVDCCTRREKVLRIKFRFLLALPSYKKEVQQELIEECTVISEHPYQAEVARGTSACVMEYPLPVGCFLPQRNLEGDPLRRIGPSQGPAYSPGGLV